MAKVRNKVRKIPEIKLSSQPGVLRRFAALCYDAILLLAVLFFATALALPFNSGIAFNSQQTFYSLYLLAISFVFYGWFWSHGGQTLGLRAWKLKLATFDGQVITWRHAFVRFLCAFLSILPFGLGFLWCIVDKNRLCWHDYLSKTRIFDCIVENP